jgi:hypothetical protein
VGTKTYKYYYYTKGNNNLKAMIFKNLKMDFGKEAYALSTIKKGQVKKGLGIGAKVIAVGLAMPIIWLSNLAVPLGISAGGTFLLGVGFSVWSKHDLRKVTKHCFKFSTK